ncbi:discoidin domain-containing protein [Methylosinus sp. Sm6]|uniref:discoidin domain-containing protein n=1 Tax=Methylosinus sp. Sm6 TaxID=2866948 RepID=UPI001C99FFC4|nr:discoidin domain-containing protein [Methylosinus sp. Sm6]MBY6242096.1 discoidin domain-containing protein [Methylosinus sp. Sm6]
MINLDELINVAPLGVARQSSLSPASLPNGAQALVEPHKRDFGCHTKQDDKPWWELDLLRPYPLNRIVIANRTHRYYRARARDLVVEASLDGQAWTTLHAGLSYFGDGKKSPAMRLELDEQVFARHIRLSLPERRNLHLRRVEILVSRRAQMLADLWLTLGFPVEPSDSPWTAKGGAYRIVEVGEGGDARIIGLKIRQVGRMGNNFVQITNALFSAKLMGLDYVWAPKLGIAEPSESVSDGATTLIPAASEPPPGLYLEGDFYHPSAFNKNAPRPDAYALAQSFIAPFIGMPPTQRDREREMELTVHIRSGDVFSADPHPSYAQPPLSYYTSIVDDLQRRGVIDRVFIVAEDRKNPCIDALEAYLQTKEIPVRLRTGGSLFEDAAYLRSARHLVFGKGSFGLGICFLAGPVETVHIFGKATFEGLPNVRELIVAAPQPGAYIIGAWKRTPEQLRLMLECPAEDLEWRRIPAKDRE